MDRHGPAQTLKLTLPTGNDPASIRARVEALEMLLERSFRIPVINMPVGLDAIVGLIPGIGDALAAAISIYMAWEARNLKLSRWQWLRMGGNIAFDAMIGTLPLVGDAADLLYRSNSRNLKIIKQHLDKHHPATQVIEGQVIDR
jgi:hypothetical protein